MPENLIELIALFQKKKIMIIGDMVADVYIDGRISRISREAPVLVLEHAGEKVVPGGAANAVYNAAALGGDILAVGIIGDDQVGHELEEILKEKKVDISGLLVENTRPTISKTRIMAGGQATVRQQVVRIDRESKKTLPVAAEQKLLAYLDNKLLDMDCVIISDYGGGTITSAVINKVIKLCKDNEICSLVDSRYNIMAYKGITVVKQNESEAAIALGWHALEDSEQLLSAGQTLTDKLGAEAVLITRGAEGMSLFTHNGSVIHIPVTNISEVYDVTGAGDTVVVTMALALAAGAGYETAAKIANFAAGVVVRKPGTAAASPAELQAAIGDYHEQETKK